MKMQIRAIAVAMLIVFCAAAHAADNLTFLYQTRVVIAGTPFSGACQAKFALVDDTSGKSLWSNDGSSVDGSEPTLAVDATSVAGVVSVMVGDTSLTNMDTLPNIIVNNRSGLSLRVWFNDLSHGWELLTPDLKLAANAHTMQRITAPLTLYVNSSLGDDAHTGLTTDTAKQTIQAAVGCLPKMLEAQVTIEVANGIYTDQVLLKGFTGPLAVIGDETTLPTAVANPAVQIDCADGGNVGLHKAFVIEDCSEVSLTGFYITKGLQEAVSVKRSQGVFSKLKVVDATFRAIVLSDRSTYVFNDCRIQTTGFEGLVLTRYSIADLYRFSSTANTADGLKAVFGSIVRVIDSIVLTNNGDDGAELSNNSELVFSSATVTGSISGNGDHSLQVDFKSMVSYRTLFTGTLSGATSVENDSLIH